MTVTAIYLGLLVYGAGVLALSFLGLLGHDQGHDGDIHDGAEIGHDADAADGHEADDGHDGDDGHDAADGQGHGGGRADGAVAGYERAGGDAARGRSGRGGSGLRVASRVASLLRSSVFLALGAGATGLFAGARGLGAPEGAAWAAGAGVLVLAISRIVRRLVRRDLDSSFKSEEFLMEEAVVSIPASPGQMGKAELRKFGADIELYVRSADPSRPLAKGERVRIVDCADECYYVEPASDRLGN